MTQPKKHKHHVRHVKHASTTSVNDKSLVKVVIQNDTGEWVRPATGDKFYIDGTPKFPSIVFEIKTDAAPPYQWNWTIVWDAQVSGLRESAKRGKKLKTFSATGNFASNDKSWEATRADAHAAFDRFVAIYAAKYPRATETLKKDRESLLAFYEFPDEHWQHLRTTNAIESTFATVRHRTTRTRNCVSRPSFLGLAFKLIEEAGKTWRRINGPEKIKLLLEGVAFKDGEPVQDDRPVQQKLAA